MDTAARRRVFPTWSISVPTSFAEIYVTRDGYWHAYDAHRSVSLTSVLLTDDEGPVTARSILDRLGSALEGAAIKELPPGVLGRAVESKATKPVRALRTLSGLLVADGCVLIVTITGDDSAWARGVWSSIRCHATTPAEPLPTTAIHGHA